MRILYVTTIGLTMGFFKDFIKELLDEGHIVDIACNENDEKVPVCYRQWGCKVHQISCSRSPLSKGNIQAIGQIKNIVKENKYDIVHCHTPIAAMCTRVACRGLRKTGTKVIYTAHGFHFYKGAPKLNWLIYYPIEKICAHWTDVLITINTEDYELAKRKMKAESVEYVPGVGINVDKFKNTKVDRIAKRKELGIPEDTFLLVSVGELNKNKNHEIIIKALTQIGNDNVHYAIAGEGELKEYLNNLSRELGIEDRVHLLGYRNDIAEIYKMANVCCFPSLREGLGLAAIEAMACGLPIISSNIHGINDYSVNNETGYKTNPKNIEGFVKAINEMIVNKRKNLEFGKNNSIKAANYSVELINLEMKKIYKI